MEFLQKLTPEQISALTPEMMMYLQDSENTKDKELCDAIEYIESYLNDLYIADRKTTIRYYKMMDTYSNLNEITVKSMYKHINYLSEHEYVYVTYIPVKYEQALDLNRTNHDSFKFDLNQYYHTTYIGMCFKINSLRNIHEMLGDCNIDIGKFIACTSVEPSFTINAKKWLTEDNCFRYSLPHIVYYRERNGTFTLGPYFTQFKFIDMIKLKEHLAKLPK